jgi:hypothetical protein
MYNYFAHDIYFCKYCKRKLKYLNHESHLKTNIHFKNIKLHYFLKWISNTKFKNKNYKYILEFI